MLVVTGVFENERFIPDKPVLFPQKKKVVITVEEEKPGKNKIPLLSMEQIEKWAKVPEIQTLIGVLKGAALPPDIKISDIRNERLTEKYKI